MFYIGVEIVFHNSCHGVQQITQLDLYMGLVAREEDGMREKTVGRKQIDC